MTARVIGRRLTEPSFAFLLNVPALLAIVLLVGYPIVYSAWLSLHHSNLKLPWAIERALSRVMVTPSIHWVHHHAFRTDTDSNYATILSLWDPLFRSRSATSRTALMRIGVEDLSDKNLGDRELA